MDHLLLNLVLAALQDSFPQIPTVTERVRQGFPLPAFRLEMKNCRLSLELGDRYRGQADFSLFYYPQSEDTVAVSDVADMLRPALCHCPGFSELQSAIASDGSLQFDFRLSAIGFQTGQQPALMEKMGLSLAFADKPGYSGG